MAAERCDKIGGSVGYAVRGETKVNITRMVMMVVVGTANPAQTERFELGGRESQVILITACYRHLQEHNSNLLLLVSCYVDCTVILN